MRCAAPTAGMLHPSINLENPESGIDLKRVCAGVKQQHKVRVVHAFHRVSDLLYRALLVHTD